MEGAGNQSIEPKRNLNELLSVRNAPCWLLIGLRFSLLSLAQFFLWKLELVEFHGEIYAQTDLGENRKEISYGWSWLQLRVEPQLLYKGYNTCFGLNLPYFNLCGIEYAPPALLGLTPDQSKE